MNTTLRTATRTRAAISRTRRPIRKAFLAHGTAVRNYAGWFCDPADADDITIEAFVELCDDAARLALPSEQLRVTLLSQVRAACQTRPPPEGMEYPSAVSSLPPDVQDALICVVYGECTYRQVARVLHQPETVIKRQLRHALTHLDATTRRSMSTGLSTSTDITSTAL